MFIKGPGVDGNIIYIDMHGFSNEIIEDLIHHPLKGGRGIAESKGYLVEVVIAPGYRESTLQLGFFSKSKLIKP